MSLASTVKAMAAAGCSAEQIADVVARIDEERREKSRARALNGLENISQWLVLRGDVFRRDGMKCVYCGSDGDSVPLHCDHVIPFSRGGKSEMSNLATACYRCNSSKRDKTPEEWRRQCQ